MNKEEKKKYDHERYLKYKDLFIARNESYRKTKAGKESFRNLCRRMYYKHHEKVRARAKLFYAKTTGKVIQQPCEICGSLKVEAHHTDYFRPLTVRWLCHIHHREIEGRTIYAQNL